MSDEVEGHGAPTGTDPAAPTPAPGQPEAVDETTSVRPAGRAPEPTLIPYLIVADARAAIEWYVANFGATRREGTITMPDGRVGHAELALGEAVFHLADPSPETPVAAPVPGAPASVSLTYWVPHLDDVVHRAVERGALLERPPVDHPYGRNAVVRDPFGHRWILFDATDPAEITYQEIRHGDIGYVSLWVGDPDRAARFFSAVLGWPPERHREVPWAAVNHGFGGGVDHHTLFLCFAVDNLETAVGRVREAGGRAEAPDLLPWGPTVMCTDPQGTRFALYELAPAGRGRRPAPSGVHHGDVAYITMEVTRSATARDFYGAVLGWQFTPGQVDDGWVPLDVAPMVGLSGGHDRPTTVPFYRVDDLDTVLERVRAAGGTAGEPEDRPYGRAADCTDDQGTRFSVGQLT